MSNAAQKGAFSSDELRNLTIFLKFVPLSNFFRHLTTRRACSHYKRCYNCICQFKNSEFVVYDHQLLIILGLLLLGKTIQATLFIQNGVKLVKTGNAY